MDLSLLIDGTSVIEYVAKYCNKVEEPTKALSAVLKTAMKYQQELGVENPKAILRKAFNRLVGHRDKTETECAHLILSSPYVCCTHIFETVNLYSSVRQVNVEGLQDELSTISNWKDIYADRFNKDHWSKVEAFNLAFRNLSNMSLRDFMKFHKKFKGKVVPRNPGSKPVVIVFSPEVKSDPGHQDFWKYAYTTLLKLKPWREFEENVFEGVKGSVPSLVNQPPQEIVEQILTAFNEYFRHSESPFLNSDNIVQRGLDQFLGDDENDINSIQSQFSIEEVNSFDEMYRNLIGGAGSLDEIDSDHLEWNQEHDFSILTQTYERSEVIEENINQAWANNKAAVPNIERKSVHLSDFDLNDIGCKQQHDAVVVFLKVSGLWKDENGNFTESPMRQEEDQSSNVILVPGPAGSGTILYYLLKN